MGNLIRKCRRSHRDEDRDVEERRLAISATLAARIETTLPRCRRRHLTNALETFLAGKKESSVTRVTFSSQILSSVSFECWRRLK
jgi:hypothetical protein